MDTRKAGIGTITINVHGMKDSFKITAKRSDGDHRILTGRYDPTVKGEYVIRMLWEGVHIPRSPFVVRIKGKPGLYIICKLSIASYLASSQPPPPPSHDHMCINNVGTLETRQIYTMKKYGTIASSCM